MKFGDVIFWIETCAHVTQFWVDKFIWSVVRINQNAMRDYGSGKKSLP